MTRTSPFAGLVLACCTSQESVRSDATPPTEETDSASSPDEEADGSSGGTGDDTAVTNGELATLAGRVVGPDAGPAEGVRVTLCHGACRYADSSPDGTFSFADIEPNSYALHFTVLGGEELGWADLLVVADLEDGEDRVLATDVPMASLGAATEVSTAREVQVAEGLWLTVDPAFVELPFDADALNLAAATPAAFPPELPAGEVLSVWYLDPFDAKASAGLTLRATNTWDLEPGEEAVLWTSSYLDYAWVEAGRVVVSEDGTEVTGGDIPVISTLVLARSGGR